MLQFRHGRVPFFSLSLVCSSVQAKCNDVFFSMNDLTGTLECTEVSFTVVLH